jgi:hypothetical protein
LGVFKLMMLSFAKLPPCETSILLIAGLAFPGVFCPCPCAATPTTAAILAPKLEFIASSIWILRSRLSIAVRLNGDETRSASRRPILMFAA